MVSHEAPSTSELLLIVKPNVYLVRPQLGGEYPELSTSLRLFQRALARGK
jgi:hypothetical protein